jgi:glutathione S-transferase
MEQHLATRDFFVDAYSIADVALFAYTDVSHQGGFPLDELPHVRAWLGRVRAQPGFVAM